MDYNERKELLKAGIENAFSGIINTASFFDNNTLNEVPFADSWTAGQVLDHVIKATGGIPDKKTIVAARPYDEKVAPIDQIFSDYSKKLKSPDFILPANGPHSKEKLLAELEQVKRKHIHTIESSDLTVVCMGFELPGMGELTRYEWLSFIAVHVRRHNYQLQRIAETMGLMKEIQQ